MTSQIVPHEDVIEHVLMMGDLARLTPEQRTSYYLKTCESLGLNPLTRPFDFITLNGKLTLYARKDAGDQLRKINGISIDKPDIQYQDDWIVVTVIAHDASGRCDSDVGVVSRKDMRGDFGNALMKAVTKAKRRVILSICGLGMLDETEVETIPDARPAMVSDNGEIIQQAARVKQTTSASYNPVQLLVDHGLAENNYDAAGILNKYAPPAVKSNADKLLAWARLYQDWRDAGSEPAAAAHNATEGIPLED